MNLLENANTKYSKKFSIYQNKLEDLQVIRDDFTSMRLQLSAVAPKTREQLNPKHSTNGDVTEVMIGRQKAQEERIEGLQKAIQELDRLELEEKWGPGPYHIQVVVQIEGDRKFMIIETAPNHLVPHSIKTFMNLVEKKVWDRTVLYHQVQHVTVGVPVDIEGDRRSPDIAKGLLFAEYSKEYPHHEKTIGFQGSPGGPEFYINLDNNVKIHGPGGQQYDDMFEEADSCFGTIIQGDGTLEQFKEMNAKALKSKNGVYYSMIESMKIVRK